MSQSRCQRERSRPAQIPARREHARVGAEQVDAAVLALDGADQRGDLVGLRHVAAASHRAIRDRGELEVCGNDRLCAFGEKSFRQCRADATPAAGDDGNCAPELHVLPPDSRVRGRILEVRCSSQALASRPIDPTAPMAQASPCRADF